MSINAASLVPTRPANPSDPSDPAYRWPAALDRAVREADQSHIRVALLLSGSPGWANGGQSYLHAPDPGAYAAIFSAASKRYPSIRRWMVWGEPNRDHFLPNADNSPVGPRAYAKVLDASYGALKAQSPKNIVIGGMTWTGGTVKPANFLKYMRLPDGRAPRLDWFGHNPFPFRFPNLRELAVPGGYRDISDLDTFGAQLRRTYGRRAKFWLSEFLVLSDRPSQEFVTSVSKAEQGRWLSAAYGIADRLPQVAGLGWLGLLDQPASPRSSNYGLLTASGGFKPAYNAFRNAPAVAYRPKVRAPTRLRTAAVKLGRLRVKVRAKLPGRVRVELYRKGRRVASKRLAAGRPAYLKLRYRHARRGAYVVTVRAPRGEAVRRVVRFR